MDEDEKHENRRRCEKRTNGKKVIPAPSDDEIWDQYRTIPISVMRKKRVGICWDFVNYQSHYFAEKGLWNFSYFVIIESPDAEEIITHTFTLVHILDKVFWFECSWEEHKGITPVKDYMDVLDRMKEKYGTNKTYSVYKYETTGLDDELSSEEFIDSVIRTGTPITTISYLQWKE